MSRIELTGLIGSHPLGALASFGLLRVLGEHDARARLSFIERDDWIAVLDAAFASQEELLQYLQKWIASRAPEVLRCFAEEDVRVPPSAFRAVLHAALLGDPVNLELASFLVGLAADGVEDNSKHLVKPSPFYMASANQSLLGTLRKIHEHVRKGQSWSEALFGPWSYATPVSSAGWDPGTERMHALRYQAPTKEKASRCVAGAVWLAFEALPLFPTFSDGGNVCAVGWVEHSSLDHLRWPLPIVPIGLGTLRVLLAAQEVAGKTDSRTPVRIREGIGAIYESTRHEFGQGYAVFRPARRLA